jgi:predicted nucleic acid-binding protein
MLEQHLAGPVATLPFDDGDAAEADRLHALLARAGTPIIPTTC